MLTKDDGLKVIAAAMGSHIRHASGDDCSKLVHDIYERAGFPYDYVNSRDLYAGADSFRRTRSPQPGDLIVWPGHVGIVVSPREHLFFSKLTSTGQDVASYDAPYWQGRGPARFFRYRKPEDAPEPAPEGPHMKKTAAARPASSLGDDPAPPQAATSGSAPDLQDPGSPSPAIVTSRRPRPEEVRQAVLQQFFQDAPALRDLRSSKDQRTLIVFDDLRVDRVRLHADQGWVEVRIHQVGSVIAGRADLVERDHRARWPMHRRDRASWQIAAPSDVSYLPREVAVAVLAHRLAALADTHDGTGANRQPAAQSLARLLSLLMEP